MSMRKPSPLSYNPHDSTGLYWQDHRSAQGSQTVPVTCCKLVTVMPLSKLRMLPTFDRDSRFPWQNKSVYTDPGLGDISDLSDSFGACESKWWYSDIMSSHRATPWLHVDAIFWCMPCDVIAHEFCTACKWPLKMICKREKHGFMPFLASLWWIEKTWKVRCIFYFKNIRTVKSGHSVLLEVFLGGVRLPLTSSSFNGRGRVLNL